MSCKTSKVLTQAKLTSLYGNISRENNSTYKKSLNSKGYNSEECVVVEKPHSYNIHSRVHHTSTYAKSEEEERAHGSGLGSKRTHIEISSPRNAITTSPSSNEEANNDVSSGNGFVTARAKLVSVLLIENDLTSLKLVLSLFLEGDYFSLFMFFQSGDINDTPTCTFRHQSGDLNGSMCLCYHAPISPQLD